MSEVKTKYPETLYVVEESRNIGYMPCGDHLVGKEALEQAVPDNGEENTVAIYQLVSINRYKKKVTRTSVIQEVTR